MVGPLRDLEIIGAFVIDKGFIPSLNASYVKNGGFIFMIERRCHLKVKDFKVTTTSLMLKEAQHT